MEHKFVFDGMIKTAEDILDGKAKFQNAQVIVVRTENDNEYGVFIADPLTKEKTEEKAFIKMLCDKNERKINYILCLWQNGGIDIPSADLRRMFADLVPENKNTGIFVMSDTGPSLIKLEITL